MLTNEARGPPCPKRPAEACTETVAGSCTDSVAANTRRLSSSRTCSTYAPSSPQPPPRGAVSSDHQHSRTGDVPIRLEGRSAALLGIEVKAGVVHKLPHGPLRRYDMGVGALEKIGPLWWFPYLGATATIASTAVSTSAVEELTQVEAGIR